MVNDIKQAMSLIAMEFYDHPEQKLKLLAFTGTKGKTTAAYFAYQILSQSHSPALLSTMNTTLDGETFFKSALKSNIGIARGTTQPHTISYAVVSSAGIILRFDKTIVKANAKIQPVTFPAQL